MIQKYINNIFKQNSLNATVFKLQAIYSTVTKTALLSIKNDIHLALARGEATTVVLLDQSEAFDTIDHGTLLDCLSSWFGVGSIGLDWFKSYLSDRSQCVKIGSILSDAKKLPIWCSSGLCPRSNTFFPCILLP